MKKYFITFGAGKNFISAGERLIKQVKLTNYFDELILYTDEDLKNDKKFWKKHSEFILNSKRGYGYWIWKSFIIRKTMKNMNNGDILMYLDSGCEIAEPKQLLIPNFFEFVKEDKIIGSPARIEKLWVKKDLITYLNVTDDEYLNTYQRQAGAVMYFICNETRNLVNLWYRICGNYHMIDDSKSIEPNFSYFKEHRHDQSIFSLLTKKYNIYSDKNIEDCVYYIRNRKGASKVKNICNNARSP